MSTLSWRPAATAAKVWVRDPSPSQAVTDTHRLSLALPMVATPTLILAHLSFWPAGVTQTFTLTTWTGSLPPSVGLQL